MQRLLHLQSLPFIKPQGHEAQDIRRRCVTGSQAGAVLTYPQTIEEQQKWRSYTNQFGSDVKNAKHGYVGYRSHKDLWMSRQGLDSFKGNEATRWGNVFESSALLLYEVLYNTKIHEFGILPDAELDWLHISPDGIAENGRLVEIKCPLYRKIKDSGWMSREYWAQTQLQLRVCNSYSMKDDNDVRFDLDFCQNTFREYSSPSIYLCDTSRTREAFMKVVQNYQHDMKSHRYNLFLFPLKGVLVQISETTSIPCPAELLGMSDEAVEWSYRVSKAVKVIAKFLLRCLRKEDSGCLSHIKPRFWYHLRMTVSNIKEDQEWFEHVRDEMKHNNETARIADFYPLPQQSLHELDSERMDVRPAKKRTLWRI